MASIIRIKRSATNGNPATLGAGELAYSALSGTISNGGDRLYIGMGTETAGNAANHVVIGGKYFTDMLDHAAGTLTASSALIVDANSKIDVINVGNLTLTGSTNTISSTDANGNIVLDPNGTGYVSIVGTNGVVIPVGTTAQRGPTVQGTIRYNTTTSAFEGYSGTVWGSLGGVKSVDGLTYISAELNPGDSDDTLRFYTANGASSVLSASLTSTLFRIGSGVATTQIDATTASTSSTTGALTVAGGVGIAGDLYLGGALNVTGAVAYTGGATFNSNLTLVGSDTAGTEFFRVQNGSTVTKFQVDSASGNTTISGTLGVTGATTLSSTLGVTGDLAVNTNKFNVTASSGNTSIAGTLGVTGATTLTGAVTAQSTLGVTGATTLSSTLDVTGNVTVNTNKFTVNATSGNTAVAGTLGVTGATTLSSTLGVTGATTLSSTLGVTGATTLSSTLAVTGDTTLTGDLAVNGGDLTTTATTFNLLNATATTLNFAGAATALTIGATTGTATIRNATVAITNNATVGGTLGVTGNTTLSGTLGVTGATTLSSTLAVTGISTFTGAVTANGGVTAAGAVTVTAGGTNTNINLVPQGTGTVDVGNKRITSVAEPTQATDAATKNYVDAVKTGLDVKDSVRVATTANLTATYSNGSSGVGATLTNSGTQAALTIDSIVLSTGDRVLVKDQTTGLQNGIYTVTDTGSASTNWVLTRAVDTDSNTPVVEVGPGMFTFVEEGTNNADNGFVCTNNGAITIGTTAITWVQFSGAGQITAGAGLTKTGNTIDAVGTANRITITADAIDIASTYVGQSSITTLGTIGTGVWQGTIVDPTYGGTGVNNAGKTITLGGNLTTSGAFATTLTVTGATSVTLPTTGTLATLAGTETFTNKTLTSPTINSGALSGTFSGAATLSGVITLSNTTDATAIGSAGVIMSGGLSVAKAVYVGTNITGAGAATSTLDGFNIDGGTY